MTILRCRASANYASNAFFENRWKLYYRDELCQKLCLHNVSKPKYPVEVSSTDKVYLVNILASKSTCFIFLSFNNFIAFVIAGLSHFRGWILGMWIPFYLANTQCLCTYHRGRGQLYCGRQAVWLHVRLEQAVQCKWRLQCECQRGIWREDHS